MKITFPDYYLKFKCIADKCEDSCCVGWEIDIDSRTREKYNAIDGDFGKEIRQKTQHGVFPLDNKGRCAFLDERGLCRIISTLGDGYLCDICREHPRYYGVGADGLDGGLGLACPEAARIILSIKEMPKTVVADASPIYECEDDFAEVSYKLRERVYDVIYSENVLTVRSAFTTLAEYADTVAFNAISGIAEDNIPIPKADDAPITDAYIQRLVDLFSNCEAIGGEWQDKLRESRFSTGATLTALILEKEDAYRSLLFYFTHRYLRECIEDMSAMGRVLLARCSADLIFLLSHTFAQADAIERAAVLFSKNIEYSTDNIDSLIDEITLEL